LTTTNSYPAKIGDIVVLKTNYFDNAGKMLDRITMHEVLGHRVGFGEPCFEVLCETDWITSGSNIERFSKHLIPFTALVEVLPKAGDQLTLF
jgi:hypothetical protein